IPIDRRRLLGAVADRDATRRAVRERLGIPAEAFVVMSCGKYASHKRPLDLVVATWSAAQNALSIWSLLAGEGSERPTIDDFCHREKVGNTVLTGFVNQSSISEYYAASDVIAITSLYDPHPLVVTEGASFGLPVIVSDQVGCIGANDTARPGINALVYPC